MARLFSATSDRAMNRRFTFWILLVVLLTAVAGAVYWQIGEERRFEQEQSGSSAARVSGSLEHVLATAIHAYNAGDEATFLGLFAKNANPPATSEIYRAVFEGVHRETLGRCTGFGVVPMQADPGIEPDMLVCSAQFEKAPRAIIGANFTREDGGWKLLQLRFEAR
jgi:hypothetical protein